MAWLAGSQRIGSALRVFLLSRGGMLAAAATIAQLVAAHFVFHNQPEGVRTAVTFSVVCRVAGFAWFAAAGLILAFGAWAAFKRPTAPWVGWLGAAAAFASVASMTLFRDGLRDLTLLEKGFDVWQRDVVANWGVVAIFLALFVAGLAVLGWLVAVTIRATPVEEAV
jgi:magnesium-transporting ATPase (P-type)